jgi:hypothetical protein
MVIMYICQCRICFCQCIIVVENLGSMQSGVIMNGDNVYLSVQNMFLSVHFMLVKSNLNKRICLHVVHIM